LPDLDPQDPYGDAEAQFFHLDYSSAFFAPLDETVASLSAPIQPLGSAFRQNLHGAVSTLEIPVTLAFAAAKHERLNGLSFASWLRVKAELVGTEHDRKGDLPEPYNTRSIEEARRGLEQELLTDDGRRAIGGKMLVVLSEALQMKGVGPAAEELLRQGVVLLWGSFEVLARDLLVTFLNIRPSEVLRLAEAPATRKHFNLRALDLAILAEHGFDVSNKIGTILAASHDLGSLGILKAVFGTLFDSGSRACEALSAKHLWILQQRRHLIVHQRGVVDADYIEATGEPHAPGDQLRVLPGDVLTYLTASRDSAMTLLRLVSDELASTSKPASDCTRAT
jgi:hypothetical protein